MAQILTVTITIISWKKYYVVALGVDENIDLKSSITEYVKGAEMRKYIYIPT